MYRLPSAQFWPKIDGSINGCQKVFVTSTLMHTKQVIFDRFFWHTYIYYEVVVSIIRNPKYAEYITLPKYGKKELFGVELWLEKFVMT